MPYTDLSFVRMYQGDPEALTLFANGPSWDFRGFWPDELQADPANGCGPYFLFVGVMLGFVEGIEVFLGHEEDDRPGVIELDEVERHPKFLWIIEQFGSIDGLEEINFRMFEGWEPDYTAPSIQGMLNLDFLNFVHTPSEYHFDCILETILVYRSAAGKSFTDSEYVLDVIIAKCLEHADGLTLSAMITMIVEHRIVVWSVSDFTGLAAFQPGIVNAVVRTWLPKLYRDGTSPLVQHFSCLRAYDPAVFLPNEESSQESR